MIDNIRMFLAAPFFAVGHVVAWVAEVISGRPIQFVVPMDIVEAIEAGVVTIDEVESQILDHVDDLIREGELSPQDREEVKASFRDMRKSMEEGE